MKRNIGDVVVPLQHPTIEDETTVVDVGLLAAKFCFPTTPPLTTRLGSAQEWRRGNARVLREGDPAILFAGYKHMAFVPHLLSGKVTNTKIGNFKHSEIIGKLSYGSKVYDEKTRKWMVLMKPRPHLLTEILPHQTQIIYQPDTYTILGLLDLRPGQTVIESGSGSGSLTAHLANAVLPGGRVRTFEFNETRYHGVHNLMQQFRMDHIVHCHFRDVYQDGFGSTETHVTSGSSVNNTQGQEGDSLEERGRQTLADCAILDLPEPWRAMPHLKSSLKPHGRLVVFSPCIEQIQRSAEWLRAHDFTGVRVFETLDKAWSTAIHKPFKQHREYGSDNRHRSRTGADENSNFISAAAESSDLTATSPLALLARIDKIYDQQQFSMHGHTSYLLMAIAAA